MSLYTINDIPLDKLFYASGINSSVNFDNFPLLYTKKNDIENNDISGCFFLNGVDLLLNKCTYFQEYTGDGQITPLQTYNKLSFIIVGAGGGAGGPTSSSSGSSGGGGGMIVASTLPGKKVSLFGYNVGGSGTGGNNGIYGYNGVESIVGLTYPNITDAFALNATGGVGGGGKRVSIGGSNIDNGIGGSGGSGIVYNYTSEPTTNYITYTVYNGSSGGNSRGSDGNYQAYDPPRITSGFGDLLITDAPANIQIGFLNYPSNYKYSSGVGGGGYGIRGGEQDVQGNNGRDGYIRCYFA